MNNELKKAIVNYMIDNSKEFQLGNHTTAKFRAYIYDVNGNYLIGGKEVGEFISIVDKQIIQY